MAPSVAIVGGGPSGLALAAMLEKQGIDYVVYERDAKGNPPAGGCLDLHRGSGQRAMKEAGCFDEMRKRGRLGDATVAKVYDHQFNFFFSWGEGRDAPELDRVDIRGSLLTVVPEEKIRWAKRVQRAHRDQDGQIVLTFDDGSTVSGFRLVIGADGSWSRLRQLVTPIKPAYSGQLFLTGKIGPPNPHYPTIEKLAGHGPMVVQGRSTAIWCQRQGNGEYRIDLGLNGAADLDKDGTVDVTDDDAVKTLMLDPHFFGGHAAEIQDMIRAMEGPFKAWPMWYFPPEHLNWSTAKGVTLIGDAAHPTSPWAGDGVNCALRDTIILAAKIKEFGVTQKALEEYEKEMFPLAISLIERSVASGKLFFHWNSPKAFLDAITKKPLFGDTDDF
ncbi:uncharacterized protein Z520_11273 [Fonsecaea multimorphosa CBS 102226]|uniref:FAD-binding domain-containing protein n=1 Tax=Fonsecaea multimorphosa CBS 102226 TaxID=1442371 RepID=A0A0D2GU26_9EURO|nr:uncharacterized protein Z520_11273 [Fonsecaea multimorphosa CBS 102226]KIX93000.1 hypothetical protein Z520_11273 [Fonsecaea multimorphosa CBS 102226]OAL18248.1 hypothetical protein AYO22_10826 [Fonsecaea multimorphosa]